MSTLVSCNDTLLFTAPPFNGLAHSLSPFNFEKLATWHDLPSTLPHDLFTPSTQYTIKQNPSNTLPPFPIRFNGWSGTPDAMIFIFSTVSSTKTFIGTVGDSFDAPPFTIVSYDLSTTSTPQVTLLDKEWNRLITLSPASSNESLNETH